MVPSNPNDGRLQALDGDDAPGGDPRFASGGDVGSVIAFFTVRQDSASEDKRKFSDDQCDTIQAEVTVSRPTAPDPEFPHDG